MKWLKGIIIVLVAVLLLSSVTVIGTEPDPTGRSATIVVVSNDATTLEKTNADYVCESGQGDDTETFLDAISDIETAGGGIIQCLGRNFYFAFDADENCELKLALPSNCTFDGGGATFTITDADPNPGGHYNYEFIGPASGAVGVTARNFTIDGNKDSIPSTAEEYLVTGEDEDNEHFTLENVILMNSSRQAVLPRGKNWHIDILTTYESQVGGIIAHGIKGLNIDGWYSEHDGYATFGVESETGENGVGQNQDINIDNWIVNNPGTYVLKVGGEGSQLDGLNVNNLIVRDANLYGISQGSLALKANFNNITIIRETGVNTTCMVLNDARVSNAWLQGYVGFGGSNIRITNVFISANYHFSSVSDTTVIGSKLNNNYRNCYNCTDVLFVANRFDAEPTDSGSTGIVYRSNQGASDSE